MDSQSLGLKGVQAVNTGTMTNNTDYDLSNTSSTGTSVSQIVAANQTALTNGSTQFTFRGPGFGDQNGITVNVNVNGVSDTASLLTAINSAIGSAGNQPTGYAASFKSAGISASIVSDASGRQQLAFTSGTADFKCKLTMRCRTR